MPDAGLMQPEVLVAAAVFLPLFGGLIVMILPETVIGRLRELAAIVFAALTALAAVALAGASGAAGLVKLRLLEFFGLTGFRLPGTVIEFPFSFSFFLDRLSLLAVAAASVLALLIIIYAWKGLRADARRSEFFFYALWALGGANLAILSDNLLLMLFGWELASVMLFYLVTLGGDRARHGAGKTMVMLGAADCALLLGIALLPAIAGSNLSLAGSLSVSTLSSQGGIPLGGGGAGLKAAAFLLMTAGALAKAGAMPLHTWIPKAAESAPPTVMALLPASVDKLMGIYLLARVSLYIFNWQGAAWVQLLLMGVGAATVFFAVMAALVQHDLKKLLSFHAVSQVGYMVLGIASGTAIGLAGAVFHMLNNSIYKSVLFLGAGAIEKRTGTTDLERLGGLGRRMPNTFAAMLVACLAISGVPLFNGFVSKWMIYGGLLEFSFKADPAPPWGLVAGIAALIAAMFGSALTLASFIKVLHSAFMGPATRECEAARPAPASMWVPMTVMAAACLVLGVVPYLIYHSFLMPITVQSGLLTVAEAQSFSMARALAPAGGGLFSPVLAAGLVFMGLLLGGVIYLLGRVGKSRVVRPYISGETTAFSAEELRFPGTGFYGTVKEIGPLAAIYRDAADGVYDPYELGGTYGQRIVNVGKTLHDGVLPTYLGYCMLGLLVVLAALLIPLLMAL